MLQSHHKWNKKQRNFQNGDIILLKTEANHNQWPVAKAVGINTDAKGFVQSVKLLVGKTRNDGKRMLDRPIHKIRTFKGVRNLIPRQGCQLSRWFDILGGARFYGHYVGKTVQKTSEMERLVWANCYCFLGF